MSQVIIIMGSKIDLTHAEKIKNKLDDFSIKNKFYIASAHKTPLKVLDIIKEHEKNETIFVTIAGRSNALSGFVDAQTHRPVLACPPYSDKFGGNDIYSTLRMPSGLAPLTILDPKEVALACAKIFALHDVDMQKKVEEYQLSFKKNIAKDNQDINNG